jgi:uncharacterized membrane protein
MQAGEINRAAGARPAGALGIGESLEPNVSDLSPPAAKPRYQLLDLLRGIAILAMVVFHVGWDLYYFGYSPVDVTTDPGWVIFQKAILTSFLLLVGAGLWLGHGAAIRWRAFWRRWLFVAVAALLVTAGTLWMLPDYYVFFGVLHAIALFSLMALALLRLPAWGQAAIGVAIVALSFAYTNPAFTDRTLAWIGFWPVSPPTSDVVPIFPWFGVVILGIAAIRFLTSSAAGQRLLALRSTLPIARGLAFLGRWSLLVYLVHQPLIIGALWVLMQLQGQPVMPAPTPNLNTEATGFLESCTSSCAAGGGTADQCTAYCDCALDQIASQDLWSAVASPNRTAAEQLLVDGVTRLCREMSR